MAINSHSSAVLLFVVNSNSNNVSCRFRLNRNIYHHRYHCHYRFGSATSPFVMRVQSRNTMLRFGEA